MIFLVPSQPQIKKLTLPAAMKKIFDQGLSSAKHVTQIAGRGVGMGSVQEQVRSHGGSVSVKNKKSGGLNVMLRIPENGL